MNKRLITFVLALVMVMSTFAVAFAEGTTPVEPIKVEDTRQLITAQEGTPDKVQQLVDAGLVLGDGTGDLKLTTNITRAEAATIVVRALGLEEIAKTSQNFPSNFKDMHQGHWANGYVNIAAANGIIQGYPEGTFLPEANITYAEAVTMFVRVLEDLTPAEKAAASWPLNYLTKAEKLGVLKESKVTDYTATALRGPVFELFFNTLTTKEGSIVADPVVAKTIEGIVVDNYRTSALDKTSVRVSLTADEILVDKDARVRNEKEDIIDIKLPEGTDSEDILGKGIIVTFDANDKLIEVKVDDKYDYIVGAVESIDTDRIVIDGKTYKLDKDTDVLGVYANNDEIEFRDTQATTDLYRFVRYTSQDVLAKVTVRSGRIMFVDAFKFDDVAPVAEKINDKNRLSYYNDARSGSLTTLEVDEFATVIKYEEGKFLVGAVKDIEEGSVIQWFKTGKQLDELTIIVRTEKDATVTGKYDQARASSAGLAGSLELRIDKTDYKAHVNTNNRNPVYSVSIEDKEFYRLSNRYADELSVFEDEEVKLLLDVFGNVQLISADTVNASRLGVITNIYGYEIELLTESKANWFVTSRSTKYVNAGVGSSEAQLKNFRIGDIVRYSASGDEIVSLELLDERFTPRTVVKFNTDVIDFGSEFFYLGGKTTVVINDGLKDYYNLTPAEFIKNYDTKAEFKATVVTNYYDSRLADVVIVTEAKELDNNRYDNLVAKIEKVNFRGNRYSIEVSFPDRSYEIYNVDGDQAEHVIKNSVVKEGSIVELKVTKTDSIVTEIKELLNESSPVFLIVRITTDRNRGENVLTLADVNNETKEIWVSKRASQFGNFSEGDYVAIGEIGQYDTVDLVDLRDSKSPKGEWADPDVVAAEKVDAAILKLPKLEALVLADKAKVVEARAALTALTPAQRSLVEEEDVLLAAEDKINQLELGNADQLYANQVINKIETLPKLTALVLENETDVIAARDAYAALTTSQQALVTNEDVLVELEEKIAELKAIKLVIDEIDGLPEVEELTLADETDVIAARDAYDELTTSQQALVTNEDVLELLELKIADLKAAQPVIDEIEALPEVEEFDIEDPVQVTAVNDAEASYDALTEDQQSLVTNLEKLTELLEIIALG